MYIFYNYINDINLNEYLETFNGVQNLELWFNVYYKSGYKYKKIYFLTYIESQINSAQKHLSSL